MKRQQKLKHNCLLMFVFVFIVVALMVGTMFLTKVPTIASLQSIYFQSAFLLIIAIAFLITSSIRKDTFPLIILVMTSQFAFCFLGEAIQFLLYIFFGCLLLGMFIHFLKFKLKFRLGSFFIPLAILLVIFAISGLGLTLEDASNLINSQIYRIINSLFALICYVFFISTMDRPVMKDIRFLVCGYAIGTMLCLFMPNIISKITGELYLLSRPMQNCVVYTICLIAIPFALSGLFNVDSFKKVWSALLSLIIFGILSVILLLFFDVINLICILIEIILMLILGIRKSSKKFSTIILFVISFVVLIASLFIAGILENNNVDINFEYIVTSLRSYFESVINLQIGVAKLIDNGAFLLGYGLDFEKNTFSSGLVYSIIISTGLVGLAGYVTYALFKYLRLFRARTTISIIACISFLCSGVLVLVSHTFISGAYIALIVFILCGLEYYVNDRLLCEYGEE